MFLISGIGLFLRKAWATEVTALFVLVFSTYYGGNEFAWGYMQVAHRVQK